MSAVTPEQALETYKRTVRDEPRETWDTWIIAISNSLAAGEWIGYEGCPAFAEDAFQLMKEEIKISMADELDRP